MVGPAEEEVKVKNLKNQRRIAAKLLKVGENKVWFDPNRLDEIASAITRTGIRHLISDLAIQAKPETNISRFRARKTALQKRKGRRKGPGSRKGTPQSRLSRKEAWMLKVRTQRKFLREIKNKKLISATNYRNIYSKIKGGFFRSKRHIKLYLTEHNLFNKKK